MQCTVLQLQHNWDEFGIGRIVEWLAPVIKPAVDYIVHIHQELDKINLIAPHFVNVIRSRTKYQ